MAGVSDFEEESVVTDPYVLYGSHASYYTAKTRSYLRKKGIPYVERLPSHSRFRSHVRPTSGSHRIPQLEMPTGEVLQDTTTIFDHLESRFPDVPALPSTPRLRLVAHLMELFASEGLILLAWRYRWFFDENLHFVKMDFGRSFRPQGSDEELLHYGQIIADRMLSRGRIEPTPELLAEMERSFAELLDCLEAHLVGHPFMLGWHPSVADYSLMGALYAHMGRDPVPLHFMQRHAPRVFRWVEHMNTPEIHSPEFPEFEVAYDADDVVPESFLAVLGHLLSEHGERFALEALAYGRHVQETQPAPGAAISTEEDQPRLPGTCISWQGEDRVVAPAVQHVWLLQRALGHYRGLPAADQASCRDLLEPVGGGMLLELEIPQPPERHHNRFLFGR